MEEQWIIDRAKLRRLMHEHPDWTTSQFTNAVGRCRKWVQKWKKRLAGTALDDQEALKRQSRKPKTRPEPYHAEVIERMLELRDHPPAAVPRKLGPRTIRYYLHTDEPLRAKRYRLPSLTSTIWQILDTHHRIIRNTKIEHVPFERPEPMDTWEIDFTDVGTAHADHDEKRQHQVEAFGVIDRGTSLLVDLQTSDLYRANSSIVAMASTLLHYGMPQCIVFDHDPRFVGSWSATAFPSAFMRFLLCLGITIDVCPPHRPDLKPFVERYFRTLKHECVHIQRPTTVARTREVFEAHQYTYNHERPNKAKIYQDQPPAVAFPELPILPSLPDKVDPDAWLDHYHHHLFRRRISAAGRVEIDKRYYYIVRKYSGQYVVCRLDAQRRVFDIILNQQVIKTMPIRGLHNNVHSFDTYLRIIVREADTEDRQVKRKRRRMTA